MSNHALIPYATAEQLAGVYAAETAAIQEAILAIGVATDRLKEAFGPEVRYRFSLEIEQGSNRFACDHQGVARLMQRMKLEAWAIVIEKLNIKRLMSSARRQQLEEALAGNQGADEFPELLPETIEKVAAGYLMSATEFLEEAVREEYDFWRPRHTSAPYQRNSDWKINPKIIRPHIIQQGYTANGWRCIYHNEKHVTALDNIFHMLAGKGPVQEYKGSLVSEIESQASGRGETEFFRFKCYKNGNLHLEFKRQDLLALFNQLAAKGDRLGQEKARA